MKFNRTENSVKYMFFGALNRIVSLLLPFILRTIFIRYLGEAYLGVNSLFTSVLQVLSLAELGFGTAVSVSMYRPIATDDTKTVCALMALYKKIYRIIGGLVFGVGICIMPFLDHFISGECPPDLNIYVLYLLYLISTASGYFLFAYKQVLLGVHQRGDIIEKVSIGYKIITCFLQAVSIIVYKNMYMYILLNMFNGIANNLTCAYIAQKKYPQYHCEGKVSKDIIHGIYKKVSALMIQKLGQTLSVQLDTIVISSFLGLIAVARYSNYLYIATSIGAFVQLFFGSMTAGIGNSLVTDTVEWNYKNFKKIQLLGSWIVGWCSICLICLYQHFIKLWTGPDTLFSFPTVICFVVYFYVAYNKRLVVTFKDAAGMWWEDKLKPLVSGIANLTVNIILVHYIGISGVIISTILSFLCIEVPWETHVLFKTYFKMKPTEYYLKHLKYLLVTIAAGGITYSVCSLIPSVTILEWLLKVVVCCIIPNIIFLIVYHRTEEFEGLKDKASMVTRRFTRK